MISFFTMIVGGIWLAFEGKWAMLVGGVIYAFLGAQLLFVFMLPGAGLTTLSMSLAERGRNLSAFILSFFGWFYNIALILVSSVAIYKLMLNVPNKGAIVPLMLWAFTLATAPWAYMASRENSTKGYNATYTTVLLQSIGLAISSVLFALGTNYLTSLTPFYICMLLLLIIQTGVIYKTIFNKNYN